MVHAAKGNGTGIRVEGLGEADAALMLHSMLHGFAGVRDKAQKTKGRVCNTRMQQPSEPSGCRTAN